MARKICIDAGHYAKYNRSPAVPEYWESKRMWELHLRLKVELEAYGFKVVTTRTIQAKDLSLHKRGMAAKGCDLFLSLHSNAAGNSVNEKVDHVAVYRLVDDNTTTLDETSKAIAEKLAPAIAEVMEVNGGYKVLTRKSSNDRNGDGQLNDNYYGVLNGARQAGTPGLLVEHSFHTNTRSTQWLLDDANLAKLARAEAAAIAEYFGVGNEPGVEVTLPILKKGATSESVMALQRMLHAMGYALGSKNPMDGNFGAKTETAVRAYQKAHGLYVDGIVGKKTWDKLLGVST